ncbi:MAG: helix-turn-helix domain-containing protein [Candidatus Promineifilaceae bacterium]|nr:helix-turn-helix domain-containing protein [Candidatus Promineifilaceae bacterium]
MTSRIDLGPIRGDGSSPRHERADAAANRRLILDTAESLFAANGVEEVTMADIAQAAGVGKGTLYRRFANKAELCLALMDAQMASFQNNTLAVISELKAADAPNMQQLTLFLDDLVHFTDRHLPLLCEVERAGLLEPGHDRELPHIWQHMTIKGLLNAAQQAGELSPRIDIEYTADALIAPLRVNLFRFQRQGKGFSLERISAGLQNIAAALAEL